MVALPLLFWEPLQLPDAVQPVVLIEVHEIVVVPPAATDEAARLSVGGPGGNNASAASAWMNP